MLNKIVLSVIICLFIISYDFKIVNADINILTNIEVESDFPDGIKYKVQTVNDLSIKSIAVRYTVELINSSFTSPENSNCEKHGIDNKKKNSKYRCLVIV